MLCNKDIISLSFILLHNSKRKTMNTIFENEPPEINRVELNLDELKNSKHEGTFNNIGVELLKEAGSYTCVVASILPVDKRAWSRDEAILGGLLVRLYKLLSALLDQTCQHRRDTTAVIGRLAFECVINIQFLIKNADPEMFEAFILYSLKHERRLRVTITENIEKRGGQVLPIEKRMLASIESSIKDSGVNIEDIKQEKWKNWSDSNLYIRANDVGLGKAYLGMISGPSQSVHGNWRDLQFYHLEEVENGYKPNLEWSMPRPQLLFAIGTITVDTLIKYLDYLIDNGQKQLCDKLLDLRERIVLADREHERYLSSRQNS